MDSLARFSTPILVRALQRHLGRRLELHRRWGLMDVARRQAAQRVYTFVSMGFILELDRRRVMRDETD